MSGQLEIEVPVERSAGDNYKEAMAEYEKQKEYKEKNHVYLCYLATQKRYFVSKWFKRQTIESYKTIRIIE